MKNKRNGRLSLLPIFLVFGFWFLVAFPLQASTDAPGRKLAKQATQTKELWITTDHSKHEILQQDFKSGPEVTKACLTCHSEAATQFHKTIHWTWKDPATGDQGLYGKGGLSVNNF